MKRPAKRLLAVLVSCLSLAVSSAHSAPTRIVDGWYAHNATLIMLGASDKIIGTVISPDRFPWMMCIAPQLREARFFSSMTLNAEAVLALHPDLVFVTKQAGSIDGLHKLGLNAVAVGFTDFTGLVETINQSAILLDTDLARAQANRYRMALSRLLAQRRSTVHAPRILHIASLAPLTVDGDQSIIDEWIRDAGGMNAATGLHGNKRPVSFEQILTWAPDIIIMGADAGNPDRLADNPLWSHIPAVTRHKVFRNPAGVFNWDRYSPELLLQIVWARQLVQKGAIDRAVMIGKIKDFYSDFYRHPIDEDDALRILDAQPPLSGKCSGMTDKIGQK
ncbi:ABC transporter substrate-binding protein [Asaia prunellae]|uniref:ABC transporter substrate-binding protein n=1 Tax=Asaia prunellae TaxID=610245 RepID=UPI00047282E8|nr:ABC transporter substrate-binding protein [Asaia prunellae]